MGWQAGQALEVKKMDVVAGFGDNAVARIAAYAAGLRFEALSEMAVVRARQVVLDTLGAMLGGCQTRLGCLAVDYAARMHPGDEATLVGDGRRTTVEGAAWGNGVTGKHLGLDDAHRTAGHVAAELVPVVLALGEERHLSGKQLITALAAGYDVFDAIQSAVDAVQRERGLDHKGQAGTLASAVSAAVAMGLEAERIANALALSMDMASGTEQYVWDSDSCDTKDLLAGYAARNGIYAAKLADFGFRGPRGALDGPYGYFHAFGPGFQPAFLDRIGVSYALASTGFKPHAGCRYVHAGVDAALELRRGGCPPLDQIVSIEIGSYREAITPAFRATVTPENSSQAAFSLPTAVCVALVRGAWYREDIAAYDDPDIRRLLSMTRVYLDDEIQSSYPAKNGCVVKVTTRDGVVHTGRVDYAKGEPENMLTDSELEAKFRRLVGELLPESQTVRLIQACSRLEVLADVVDLVKMTVRV